MSRQLSYNLGRKGQLNTPGITAASKKAAEELLLKDAEDHHCYFRSAGLHNHLSHHILAAYDLGAPAVHLKRIYEDEAKMQRPRILEENDKSITVNKDNWVQYLENQSAYSSYVQFFSEEVANLGATGALEKYIFSEEANSEGKNMLVRLMAGAVHPLIHIGYGAEFGDDTLIATGLAETAIHTIIEGSIFKVDKSPPAKSATLLELLRRVYDSDALKPVPYDPDAFINTRMKDALKNGGTQEVERLCAEYHISDNITDAELDRKVEEVIWTATLLMSATGRKGRKPRLDFFLMHLVTSSLFLRPICAVLKKSEHKAALLRAYVPVLVMLVLSRGRPRINPELVMSYSDVPRPPAAKGAEALHPSSSAIGSPVDNETYNPWPVMIEGVRYHSDSHVLKALRTLVYAAQHYGDTPAGKVIGVYRDEGKKEETHEGISKVDGTIFVRAAGVLMDYMGWSGHGQKEGEWDRSALGWDAAWDNED